MKEQHPGFENIIELVIPYLSDSNDFFNISILNKSLNQILTKYYQSDLYQITFGHDPIELDILQKKHSDSYNWLELYNERLTQSKLYTWGSLRNARLGYTAKSFDLTDETQRSFLNGLDHRKVALGVNSPFRVPFGQNLSADAGNSIIQMSTGGFSTQLLTSNGKVYTTGGTYHAGNKSCGAPRSALDYGSLTSLIQESNIHISKLLGRFNSPLNIIPVGGGVTEEQDSLVDDLLKECLGDNVNIKRVVSRSSLPEIYFEKYPGDYNEIKDITKFTKISSGRCHFLALGEDGYVYSWDGPDTVQGIKILFADDELNSNNYPVVDVKCGWDFNSCYKYGLGIVIWKQREPVSSENKFFAICSDYTVVPDTSDILDYLALQDGRIVYIDKKTNALHVYHNGESRVLIPKNVTEVQGARNKLAVFMNDGKVTLCEIDHLGIKNLSPIRLGESQIKSVQFGDYHIVILTAEGKLYSMGTEPQFSGCLGLGSAKHVCDTLRVGFREGFQDLKVLEPQMITRNLPENYTCIKFSTGGWQSCAVII